MELVNITKHPVDLRLPGHPEITLPGMGDDAPELPVEILGGWTASLGDAECPVVLTRLIPGGELPQQRPGVLLVASQLTCLAFPQRRDLTFPYPLVRDEKGRVAYATGLGQVPASEGASQ